MLWLTLAYLVGLFLPSLVLSQQNLTFIEGFISSLTTLGFTDFGQTLLHINQTSEGQLILEQLSSGANFTVFVPSNEAFSTFNTTNVTEASNPATLANLIAYHIMPGTFSQPNATSLTGGNATTNATLISAIFPNVTIGRTLLDNSSFVQLEGNKSQVLAWTIFPNNTTNVTSQTILNQPPTQPNVTVFNETTFENILVAFVTAVFTPPQNVSVTLEEFNLTTWTSVLSATTFTNSSSVNTTILENIETRTGFTAFIPNDAALLGFDIGSLESNETNLLTVVQNHIINDTTVYSPLLFNASLNWTSAAGEPYTFMSNSSGNFVTIGIVSSGENQTAAAQIIQSDILVSNGVLHIIDAPLNATASNSSAATSAFLSASSAATIITSATGPIGSVFTSLSFVMPSSSFNSTSSSLSSAPSSSATPSSSV